MAAIIQAEDATGGVIRSAEVRMPLTEADVAEIRETWGRIHGMVRLVLEYVDL